MRTIKFRAWDARRQDMVYQNSMSRAHFSDVFSITRKNNGVVLTNIMQFTGLTDKNGVEIYEGDIVKDNHTKVIKIVKWNDEYCAFVLEDSEDRIYQWMAIIKPLMPHSVIGNIHQHPHLLNQ